MDQGIGAAARLPGSDRKDLAIQALAGSETVTNLAARHGVSRKFVYQQTHKARATLDDAFSPATPDSAVLFELAVTKAWLRQIIVGLALIGRSSYRGIVEFLRDLLGVAISIGCVHDVLQAATRRASAINRDQDLSGIRVGLHDELFQGATPVLAGVDAASTFCYILAAEDRRDADTWGVHLLDAAAQGLRPDYTIADAGQGLRAGQRAAWGERRPAMATCSTSSASARGWPTRCRAWPRAPRRGARRCRPRPAAPASTIETTSWLPNWRSRDRARPKRAWFRTCSNQVTRARGKRRPVKARFQLEQRPIGRLRASPWSSPLGLKRSQAQQGQPVRMVLASHQLARALALALGMAAAQEAAVVQKEPQQVQV